MRKIITTILIIAIIVTAVCFTGCYNNEERAKNIQKSQTFIITDEETGVQYIVYRERDNWAGMGGITPRYNSDGTLHTVNDKEKTDSLNIKREYDECGRLEKN